MRSVVQFWTSTSLNSAMVAENISVSISQGRKWVAQNLIPIILGTIIVKHVSMIFFFAEIVANTGQGEAAFPSKTIFVKNVEKKVERLALCA